MANITNIKDFKQQLKDAQEREQTRAQAEEMSAKVKDMILEHMAGIYFRVEQLRYVTGEQTTVAEVVDKMPSESPISKAVKFSWTQDYMIEAFHKIMQEDGEKVDLEILGNLKIIEAPNGPVILKI